MANSLYSRKSRIYASLIAVRKTTRRGIGRYCCGGKGVLAAAGGVSSREKMNHQRDERKDQEQMNQKARHVVHNEASDPRKEQQ